MDREDKSLRFLRPVARRTPPLRRGVSLLPGLFKAAARNLGRGAAGVGLFETGTVAFPTDRGPAPIYGVGWRPTDDELAKLFEAIPEQPLHLAVVLAGERERSGWWGGGRDADWSDADREEFVAWRDGKPLTSRAPSPSAAPAVSMTPS